MVVPSNGRRRRRREKPNDFFLLLRWTLFAASASPKNEPVLEDVVIILLGVLEKKEKEIFKRKRQEMVRGERTKANVFSFSMSLFEVDGVVLHSLSELALALSCRSPESGWPAWRHSAAEPSRLGGGRRRRRRRRDRKREREKRVVGERRGECEIKNKTKNRKSIVQFSSTLPSLSPSSRSRNPVD